MHIYMMICIHDKDLRVLYEEVLYTAIRIFNIVSFLVAVVYIYIRR